MISISFFMSSCSGGGSGNKVSSESIDDPGSSVDALGFRILIRLSFKFRRHRAIMSQRTMDKMFSRAISGLLSLYRAIHPILTKFFSVMAGRIKLKP